MISGIEALLRSDGLGRAAELTGRTESVLSGTGSAIPRSCIAERKCSLGASVCRAFDQAVLHVYRSASMGCTEGALAAKPPRGGPPGVVHRSSSSERNSLPQALAPSCEESIGAANRVESRKCSSSDVLSGLLSGEEADWREEVDRLRKAQRMATPFRVGKGLCPPPISCMRRSVRSGAMTFS